MPAKVAVVLFNDFETLDAFGPVEILGRIRDDYTISFYSQKGGVIRNHHGICIETAPMDEIIHGTDIVLIPGGPGSRHEVGNSAFIDMIRRSCEKTTYVLTVCTGSALLAQSGLLDGKKATSNKKAFAWATSFGGGVHWIREARWTVDGKYYTSSGVSAGMDMVFGFLSDRHNVQFARKVAADMEYQWHEDKDFDPFTNNDRS